MQMYAQHTLARALYVKRLIHMGICLAGRGGAYRLAYRCRLAVNLTVAVSQQAVTIKDAGGGHILGLAVFEHHSEGSASVSVLCIAYHRHCWQVHLEVHLAMAGTARSLFGCCLTSF